MRIDILTLFPDVFEPYISTSILGRAVREAHIDMHIWNIRDFATDAHKTVDDTPYGGGAGMVMKIEPIHKALEAVFTDAEKQDLGKPHVFVLSARGNQFTQQKAQEYSAMKHLIFICGRYEGIDQRVADYLADEEICIGPYVLAGGELGALVITEAVARLLPGVLGNPLSLTEESHATSGVIEAPQYTKPEEYHTWKVPPVLLSGNHKEITAWRNNPTSL